MPRVWTQIQLSTPSEKPGRSGCTTCLAAMTMRLTSVHLAGPPGYRNHKTLPGIHTNSQRRNHRKIMGLAFTRRGQSNRVERHGKVFQSLTEADFYSALLNVRTPFEWQAEFVLQEGVPKTLRFCYFQAGVHKIKCTVDFLFWTPNETRCIVDTKGSKSMLLNDQ